MEKRGLFHGRKPSEIKSGDTYISKDLIDELVNKPKDKLEQAIKDRLDEIKCKNTNIQS